MCFSGLFGDPAGDAAAAAAADARKKEQERQRKLDAGMANINTAFSGFNDKFYNDRSKAYVDYATPQLRDQYGDGRKSLVYALNDAGTLGNSSISADRMAKLKGIFDRNAVAIKGQGQDMANSLRGNVNQSKQGLVNQLYATEDPLGVNQQALSESKALTQPVGFTPLQGLFQGVAQGIGNAGSNPYNNYQGILPSLFARNDAQRVVN